MDWIDRRIILFGTLLLLFLGCENEDTKPELSLEAAYFLEVGFGNEFRPSFDNLRKWTEDIKIFVPDTTYSELMNELEQIIDEINDLSSTIKLQRVYSQSESNYIVFFGNANTYVNQYEGKAANWVTNNYGLFFTYWDDFEIFRGTMYVDVTRTEGIDCQKHLLREELTQSLGLMNDTNGYENSVFHQQFTCTNQYAEIDKVLIDYILRAELKPGMTREEVCSIIVDW